MNVDWVTPDLNERQAARFWSRVNKTSTCWNWTGILVRGYGRVTVPIQGRAKQQPIVAHRVAYWLAHGDLPATPLDHICRNKACVNPAHLEPVTAAENLRRGGGNPGAGLRAKDRGECVRGHVLAVVGLTGRKRPRCAQCSRDRVRRAA